jgi:hypothetical protein
VIDTKRTAGVFTSTVKNGARDDIRIAPAGSIELNGGTAIALDSANGVKNEGAITIKDASDATAILASAGGTGEISNSGKITITETYAATDADKDGDADGPFSKQAGNAGIKTAGAFSGNVTNSGAISIRGNQGAGISLSGPLTGGLTHGGSIDVLGDGAVGVRTGAVTGNVKILGAISAQGAGAVGLAVEGPVGGQLLIQGTIGSTGYRSTTAPVDTSKLDADDLLQGGPAVRIAGSVSGGIVFAVRPKDNDPKEADEDKDGIEDAKEGNASIAAFGAAPAVQIGSASGAVAIGAVAGEPTGFGIVLNGEVQGSGVYKGVDANGVQLGGTGGTVSVAGGMAVNGAVSAKSVDANATAIRFGTGASVPRLTVGGTLAATSGGGTAVTVRAVSIDVGASLPSLSNTGTISATASGDAVATAIRDASGTLGLIENMGTISASSKKAAVENAVAIDLQANGTGATVQQRSGPANAPAPKITGAVLFGAGDDVFEIGDGLMVGTTRFGAGNNRLTLGGDAILQGDVVFGAGADVVALGGTSIMAGTLDLGGGADSLSIAGTSLFTGKILNGSGTAVTVNGGTLDVRNAGPVALGSLAVAGGGVLGVTIDPLTKSATQYQVGTASFAQGSKVAVAVASVGTAEGQYVIVKAGSLTGGSNLTATNALLPFMFKGAVSTDQAAGQISLKVERKSVAELGLTRSQASAYDAVFKTLDRDAKIAGVFLGIRDGGGFQDAVQQMLPDHAGGVFETVTRGSRTLGSYIADPNAAVAELGGGLGFWLQQGVWGTSKSQGDTAAFRSSGWGASGGLELGTGIGKVGLSLAYLNGKTSQRRIDHQVDSDQYEAAVHWRNAWGGFNAYARASAALVNLDGSRQFIGALGSETVKRQAASSWDGKLYTASAGLSYQLSSGRLTVRPNAAIDYLRFDEDGHVEHGGGDALNLAVASRSSDELAGSASLTLGYDLGRDDRLLRLELEGGRRELLAGSLGQTVASFKDGKAFALAPDERDSGWLGKLRLVAGGESFRFGGEASAEEQNGRAALGFRATVSAAF